MKNTKLNNMNFFKQINDPYIISEIGVNHENDINLAKKMISQSAKGGASAVKFQTYKADKISSKDSPYYWDLKEEKTKTQFQLFNKFDKFNENLSNSSLTLDTIDDFKNLKKLISLCKKDKKDKNYISTKNIIKNLKFIKTTKYTPKKSSSQIDTDLVYYYDK